ncbi:MAG: hypothetical protein K8I65_16215 [Thermoanaerobaculia bacterium]|nr:hypothetical protein [Thermoanaerobaculia bacterium]
MSFEPTPLRLWRALPRDVRSEAARAFWERPSEEAALAAAREIVTILRVRPQAFHKIPIEQRVRAVAGLAHPPEALVDALLVSLHVGPRRKLLADFLDAIGVPHEDGLIAEDAELPEAIDVPTVRAALDRLRPLHEPDAIRVYWNALWLQDPGRWAALETVAGEV